MTLDASHSADASLNLNTTAINESINCSASQSTESKNENPGAKTLEGDTLCEALLKQIEYYFSRQNLSTDAFLVSQMNSDLYVPVTTILSFKMVKALTDDISLLKSVMKQSKHVVVDPTGAMVRPNFQNKRATVIIRDISSAANPEEIRSIFEGDLASKIKGIRSDIGDTWFVQFDDEEVALSALELCRSRTFRGAAVKARIKSENLLRNFYLPGMDGPRTAAGGAAASVPSEVYSQGAASPLPYYAAAPVWGRPVDPYASYAPPNSDPTYWTAQSAPHAAARPRTAYPAKAHRTLQLNSPPFANTHTPSPPPPIFTGRAQKYSREELLQVFRRLPPFTMPLALRYSAAPVILAAPALQLESTKSWPHVEEGEEDGEGYGYEGEGSRRNSRVRTRSYSESGGQQHGVRHDSTDSSQAHKVSPSPQPQPQPQHRRVQRLLDTAAPEAREEKTQWAVEQDKELGNDSRGAGRGDKELGNDSRGAGRGDKRVQQATGACVAAAVAAGATSKGEIVKTLRRLDESSSSCSAAAPSTALAAIAAPATPTPTPSPWGLGARKVHDASQQHPAAAPTQSPVAAPPIQPSAAAATMAAAPRHQQQAGGAEHCSGRGGEGAAGDKVPAKVAPPPAARPPATLDTHATRAPSAAAAPAPAAASTAPAAAPRAWPSVSALPPASVSALPPASRPQLEQQRSSARPAAPHAPPATSDGCACVSATPAASASDLKRSVVRPTSHRHPSQPHTAPASPPRADLCPHAVTRPQGALHAMKPAPGALQGAHIDASHPCAVQPTAALPADSTSPNTPSADTARNKTRTYADAAKTVAATPAAPATPAPAPPAAARTAPQHPPPPPVQQQWRGGGAGAVRRDAERHTPRDNAQAAESAAASDALGGRTPRASRSAAASPSHAPSQRHHHPNTKHAALKHKAQVGTAEESGSKKSSGASHTLRNGKSRTSYHHPLPRTQPPAVPHPPSHPATATPPPQHHLSAHTLPAVPTSA